MMSSDHVDRPWLFKSVNILYQTYPDMTCVCKAFCKVCKAYIVPNYQKAFCKVCKDPIMKDIRLFINGIYLMMVRV